ncbi:stress responsive A/B barrel domain protein [Hypoxylon trugodes]|uniref:stress responsive A/B barrel domain protein n=1 Tax=Hypoxylon trugodes TaxID=326681 RepID=UPI002191EF9B|nr:stress responsive A/B barrel domain protein [Hypoxylon trugodes]KAI1383803.1 stress responsive A/B barrel domain protein [Hypoxylon trugodes]
MIIHRVTLFNIPKEEDIDFLVSQYQVLKQEAVKDGQPYIQSVIAGRALPDERSRGYTLVGKTIFRNLDDMKYYDKECEAHKRFKAHAAPRRVGDVLTVYFEESGTT